MPHLSVQLNQLHEADLNQIIALCRADGYVANNVPKREKIAQLLTWADQQGDRLAQIHAALANIGGAPPGPPQPARPVRPLTLQDMARGLLNALIVAYPDKTSATTLLLAVDFPRHLIPAADEPRHLWLDVCQRIANGVTPGAFEPLLVQAAKEHPKNSEFAAFRRK